MKCIVWLGNPGQKYANTRHNVGFFFAHMLHAAWELDPWQESRDFQALIARGEVGGEKIILSKPLTYMNLSGQSIEKLLAYYKLDIDKDLLVISDDIDMEFGKIRYRQKWSHGGQNGLRDIIARLGSDVFARIKVGIGRHERMDVTDWVLSRFSPEERAYLEDEVFSQVEDRIHKWIHG